MVDVILTGRPLPPDIQYYLDCSVECHNIPLDVYFWARNFCPNIVELIDNLDRMEEFRFESHWQSLAKHCSWVERTYLDWQETADIHEVAVCLAYGAYYMGTTMADNILLETLSSVAVSTNDMLMSIPFYAQNTRFKSNGIAFLDGMSLFERNRGFFESRYRVIKQFEEIQQHVDFQDIRIVRPPAITRGDILREIRGNSSWQNATVIPKEKRKALKRSAKLLNEVSGGNTVQLFLSGDEVSVTGDKYRFSLTKPPYGAPITSSHGSAVTRVYSRESDEFVCGLCVYSPNVTVFDHLASIVMHCKSGLEDIIIEEANITERGNLELLPQGKKDQIAQRERERANRDAQRKETGIPAIEFGMFGALLPEVAESKNRAEVINKRVQEKLVRRIKKKYPHLFIRLEKPVEYLGTILGTQPPMLT